MPDSVVTSNVDGAAIDRPRACECSLHAGTRAVVALLFVQSLRLLEEGDGGPRPSEPVVRRVGLPLCGFGSPRYVIEGYALNLGSLPRHERCIVVTAYAE